MEWNGMECNVFMYVCMFPLYTWHFSISSLFLNRQDIECFGWLIHVNPQSCLWNPIFFGYLPGPLLGSIIFTDSRIIWVHSSPSYCERRLETTSVSHVNTFKKMLGSAPLLGVGKGRAADLRFIESVGRTIAQYANRSKIFGINMYKWCRMMPLRVSKFLNYEYRRCRHGLANLLDIWHSCVAWCFTRLLNLLACGPWEACWVQATTMRAYGAGIVYI